jgi:flagellum-specific peptidoglycan hydrolase FlgJ
MSFHPYQTTWLQKFAPLARANEARFGVPALFTLAQQLVESAWRLNKLGNNFFGVKSHGYKGATNKQKTHEYDTSGHKYNTADVFRAYPTEAAAYAGHAEFLRAQPRYRLAFQTTDPVEFAKRIAGAHYATDPDYFAKLKKNIYFLQGKPLPTGGGGAGLGAGAVLALAGLAYLLSKRKR